MKDFILRLRAEVDVGDAGWYEDQKAALGIRFLDELGHGLARAQLNPFQFPGVDPGVRRGLLRKFPYSVYFTVGATSVAVIALLHQHRHPDTWKGRK